MFEEFLKIIHRADESKPWHELIYDEPKNFNQFIEFVNNISNLSSLNALRDPFIFRGQSNSKWGLKPKVVRMVEDITLEWALRLEWDSIKNFKHNSKLFLQPQLIPEDNKTGAWLGLMQQYGAPTRMLDWTSSFNIALYFAVNENLDKNGAVWVFTPHNIYESMKKIPSPPENEEKEIFSREDKFIEYGLQAPPKIDVYDPEVKTERFIVQKSIFTYCYQLFSDHADLIGKALIGHNKEKQTFPLLKIIISSKVKKGVKIHLNKLNITAESIFPGIDGLGKGIKEKFEIHVDSIKLDEEKTRNKNHQ